MEWYLVYTKPRQEKTALTNLEQQGYECYLPMLKTEKLKQGQVSISEEALFARYLFIQLNTDRHAKDWGPIRSTKGVSRLVTFGQLPAKVDERLVEQLRIECAHRSVPAPLFQPHERLRISSGAFANLEAVFEMKDSEGRAMVLIQLLSKPCRLSIAPAALRKLA